MKLSKNRTVSKRRSFNQARRPKWAPKQTQENEVCETIRRNIRDDSDRIRTYEMEINRRLQQIRQLEKDIATFQLQRHQLREAEANVPNLPGPDIPNRFRGRLGALIRVLQALGQTYDALTLADAFTRAHAILRAECDLDQQITRKTEQIEELQHQKSGFQNRLDDRVAWMERHFKAFDDNGCLGEAFNSYRFTP